MPLFDPDQPMHLDPRPSRGLRVPDVHSHGKAFWEAL